MPPVISDNKYLLAIRSFSSCQARSGELSAARRETRRCKKKKKKSPFAFSSDSTLISPRTTRITRMIVLLTMHARVCRRLRFPRTSARERKQK